MEVPPEKENYFTVTPQNISKIKKKRDSRIIGIVVTAQCQLSTTVKQNSVSAKTRKRKY